MKKFFDKIRRTLRIILAYLVAIPFICMFTFFVFGPPLAMLAETFDLLRCDAVEDCKVTRVEQVVGGHGAQSIRVHYEFKARGKAVESSRIFPGFSLLAISGDTWLARTYTTGKTYRVYYLSTDPQICYLERGWSNTSISLTAIIWGGIMFVYSRPKIAALWSLSTTTMIYGFAMFIIRIPTVYVDQVGWHLLVLLLIGSITGAYAFHRSHVSSESAVAAA